MTLTLICGIPNAGKTTYSEKFENVIHLDDYTNREADITYSRCNEMVVQSESDVCVEGVYGTVKRRKDLLEAVGDKFDKKICIWLNTPKDECIKRENRGRPDVLVVVHSKRMVPPTKDEG